MKFILKFFNPQPPLLAIYTKEKRKRKRKLLKVINNYEIR